ncbi:IS66 family transposase [Desulfurivibrio dismutans]|uniref:IS66 family transposase n=1 Tax=Desulfurivibrio dismutans TaxID=1398908 RepID=UPI0023DB8261|nr:IS66 family transposase [Desulfurivibrio alkaliphilus]MDF1615674.1 IS66 family transposase [Desulfurivibrio alkaliphilus]
MRYVVGMTSIPADTPEYVQQLIAERDLLREQVDLLLAQVKLLRAQLFGRKSEKMADILSPQLPLFDEQAAAGDQAEEAYEPEVQVAPHSRRKKGRKPLPEDLPRVEVVHDVSAEAKTCACGGEKSRIGEDVSEQLDMIPARMQVIRHIRPKYACRQCEGVEDQGPTVVIAPAPEQMIAKSIASPGLLAHVLTAKFADALPFYRQEGQFARLGVEIGRGVMCGWAMKVARRCEPLLELMQEEIRSGPVVNVDETTVQVLAEIGRAAKAKSYMWVFRGGAPERPALVFQYQPTRSGDPAAVFLRGYRGCVQTDGYIGYDFLDHQPGVIHAGCWAHARRKFNDVLKAAGKPAKREGIADEALGWIGKLYKIEAHMREAGLDQEAIYRQRQEQAVPLLADFRQWLLARQREVPPRSLLGKAIAYTLSQWKRLQRYVEHGLLRLDNNSAENAIRPFVVGRKNWLFSGTPQGAKASAAIYSIIETAKANGLEPYWYLRALFERLPAAGTKAQIKALLPQYIDRNLVVAR